MTIDRAQEFQERMAKEATAMLCLLGDAMDTGKWEQSIILIGRAWNIPDKDTLRRLDTIAATRAHMKQAWDTPAYQEADLPMNATGMETLDNVWDLFETTTRLNDPRERTVLFDIANELAECQNLLDWVEKTPEEQAEMEALLTAGESVECKDLQDQDETVPKDQAQLEVPSA